MRTGKDTAQLIVERFPDHPEYQDQTEFTFNSENNSEKYVFFLSMDELYQITREALKASSETVQINKPGA